MEDPSLVMWPAGLRRLPLRMTRRECHPGTPRMLLRMTRIALWPMESAFISAAGVTGEWPDCAGSGWGWPDRVARRGSAAARGLVGSYPRRPGAADAPSGEAGLGVGGGRVSAG